MKKLILTIIIVLPLISYADTLDHWSVYLNNIPIGNFNSTSNDINIILNRKLIQQNDTISIIYGNDTPCSTCEYYYAVKDKNNGTKIHVERRNKILKKIDFPLLKIKKFTQSKEFEFFVYIYKSLTNNQNKHTILIQLKIE